MVFYLLYFSLAELAEIAGTCHLTLDSCFLHSLVRLLLLLFDERVLAV